MRLLAVLFTLLLAACTSRNSMEPGEMLVLSCWHNLDVVTINGSYFLKDYGGSQPIYHRLADGVKLNAVCPRSLSVDG